MARWRDAGRGVPGADAAGYAARRRNAALLRSRTTPVRRPSLSSVLYLVGTGFSPR
jgi:hypothetical protein